VSTCRKCGELFPASAGRGRPRVYCEPCSPRRSVIPRERVEKVCENCSQPFLAVDSDRVRFCSPECRQRKHKRRPCAGCGSPVWVGGKSAPEPMCRECRGPKHGELAMYSKRGCRCDMCRAAKAADARAYTAKRREAGRPLRRRRESRDCQHCGLTFMGRIEGGQRFCSMHCARDAQGKSPAPKFKVAKSVRVAIYEAADWLCQLCESPVRPEEDPNHPRYPTLDHIQPRALGGSDAPENLRLACRQCNTLRGVNVDWTPLEVLANVSA